jgi:hypothetical protein
LGSRPRSGENALVVDAKPFVEARSTVILKLPMSQLSKTPEVSIGVAASKTQRNPSFEV